MNVTHTLKTLIHTGSTILPCFSEDGRTHGLDNNCFTFEGFDGVGKTSLIQEVAKQLKERGINGRRVSLFEASGIGKDIRKILLENSHLTHLQQFLLIQVAIESLIIKLNENCDKIREDSDPIYLVDRWGFSSFLYQNEVPAQRQLELGRLIFKPFSQKEEDSYDWKFPLTFYIHLAPGARRNRLHARGSLDRLDKQGLSGEARVDVPDLIRRVPFPIYVLDGRKSVEELAQEVIGIIELVREGEDENPLIFSGEPNS